MNFLEERELLWVVGPVGDDVVDDIRDTFVVEMNQDLQRKCKTRPGWNKKPTLTVSANSLPVVEACDPQSRMILWVLGRTDWARQRVIRMSQAAEMTWMLRVSMMMWTAGRTRLG